MIKNLNGLLYHRDYCPEILMRLFFFIACSQVLGDRNKTERRGSWRSRGRPRDGSVAADRCRGHRSGECRKELQKPPLDDETAGNMFALASGLAGEFSDTRAAPSTFIFVFICSVCICPLQKCDRNKVAFTMERPLFFGCWISWFLMAKSLLFTPFFKNWSQQGALHVNLIREWLHWRGSKEAYCQYDKNHPAFPSTT